MAKQKWFFQLQPKVAAHLQEKYAHYQLGFQDECKCRVYEVYTVVKKGEDKATELIVIYVKSLNKLIDPVFYTYISNQ